MNKKKELPGLFEDDGVGLKEVFKRWLSAFGSVRFQRSSYYVSDEQFDVYYDLLLSKWKKGVINGNPMQVLFEYLDSFPLRITKDKRDIKSDSPDISSFGENPNNLNIWFYKKKYGLTTIEQIEEHKRKKQEKKNERKRKKDNPVKKITIKAIYPDGTEKDFGSYREIKK